MYKGSSQKDINDAVLHSEYDEKRQRNELKDYVKELRNKLIKFDPELKEFLEFWRECHCFIKKLESC